MARPKENDFRRNTKDKLAQIVAYRCSRPDCRIPTIGPKANDEDADSIGRAAHICAASPSGPRYDPNMKAEQIRSFDNGIWLCANHASEIDSDNSNYSVATLDGWKKQAIDAARLEKGNKLPAKSDAVETLLVATGASIKAVPSMIENVHKASSLALEQLDPRFGVKSSYINQQEHFEIFAKENVSIKLNVNPRNPQEFAQNYFNWAKQGYDLDVDASEINVEGSELFKEIFNQSGRLKIGAPTKDALVKLWVVLSDGKEEHFEDLPGKISVGAEGFKFDGCSLSQLLELSIKKTSFEDTAGQFSISLNLAKWDDMDVTKLAYFDKFKSFFDALAKGSELFVALEIEGNRLFSTKKMRVDDNEYFQYISCYLVYTNAVRVLAKYTSQIIKFKSSYTFSAEQYAEVLELQRIAENKAIITKEQLKSKMTCECCFESEAAIDVVEQGLEPASLKFVEEVGLSLQVFGQFITLFPKVHIYHPVKLKLLGRKKKFLVNQNLKIELIPLDGFNITTLFDTHA